MRREHRRVARPLDAGAELLPGNGAVGGVRTQHVLGDGGERRLVRRLIGPADIGREPAGAVGEGPVPQRAHHRGDPIRVEPAFVDQPRDRERDGQDRVAERVFIRLRHAAGDKVQKGVDADWGGAAAHR
jgi:hypothetical protein